MCKKLGATYMFVGDDWYNTERFNQYEAEFKLHGINIVYFPYTDSISSTSIRETLSLKR